MSIFLLFISLWVLFKGAFSLWISLRICKFTMLFSVEGLSNEEIELQFMKQLDDHEQQKSSTDAVLVDIEKRYQEEKDTLTNKLQGILGYQTMNAMERENILLSLVQCRLRGIQEMNLESCGICIGLTERIRATKYCRYFWMFLRLLKILPDTIKDSSKELSLPRCFLSHHIMVLAIKFMYYVISSLTYFDFLKINKSIEQCHWRGTGIVPQAVETSIEIFLNYIYCKVYKMLGQNWKTKIEVHFRWKWPLDFI